MTGGVGLNDNLKVSWIEAGVGFSSAIVKSSGYVTVSVPVTSPNRFFKNK